jgi:hypothetical protein
MKKENVAQALAAGIIVTAASVAVTALAFAAYHATRSIDHDFVCVRSAVVQDILEVNSRRVLVLLDTGEQQEISLLQPVYKDHSVCLEKDWQPTKQNS